MKITFLGANREVTGSCYRLENNSKHQILIDCGLFQGAGLNTVRKNTRLHFNPLAIDAVLITHTHLDHIGRLPILVQNGFRRPIYVTPPTADLARLILEDNYKIMEAEARALQTEPVYAYDDIIRALSLFQPIDYYRSFSPAPGFQVKFFNAGHILGSSFIEVNADGKKIVFSGDLGNKSSPIIKKRSDCRGADALVIESTYGNIVHENLLQRRKIFKQCILDSLKSKGAILIPAFAIERTQEVLFDFNHLIENREIPRIPLFLDSPMAISANEIFKKYKTRYFNQKSLAVFNWDDDIFSFPGMALCTTTQQSKLVNHVPNPKIIVAGAGMMTGGRILFHAKRYLSDPQSSLIFVGFQPKNTLGRRILDGEKRVEIHSEHLTVRARIQAIGAFSSHADAPQIISWVKKMEQKPDKIFITHGEMKQSKGLLGRFNQELGLKASIPKERTGAEI